MESPEDNFKCTICTDSYSEFINTKLPRNLRCGHTLCHNCACKILEEETIKCPFCNHISIVPENDVRKLPKNARMLDEMDEARRIARLEQARLAREREEAEAEALAAEVERRLRAESDEAAERLRLLRAEKFEKEFMVRLNREREAEEAGNTSERTVEPEADAETEESDQFVRVSRNASPETPERVESESEDSDSEDSEEDTGSEEEQVPEEVEDGEFAAELRLNIPCAEKSEHRAVLYCLKCEMPFCVECCKTVHKPNTLSNHQIVRLTEKPEPLIHCKLHPHNIAELICKQPDCQYKNEPMCTTCHIYEEHKGHEHDVVEKFCKEVRKDVEKCLENVEKKQSICRKYLGNFDKCLATYTGEQVEHERAEITKFYDLAKERALRELECFVDERTEKLVAKMGDYEDRMDTLDQMHIELSSIRNMERIELIKNHPKIESFVGFADVQIDKPADLKPFTSFTPLYPPLEKLNFNLVDNVAIYFDEVNWNGKQNIKSALDENSVPNTLYGTEFGNSYIYKERHSILLVEEQPVATTVIPDHSICVVLRWTWSEYDDSLFERLQNNMALTYLKKIIVAVYKDTPDWMREGIQEAMEIDKRVEIFDYVNVVTILDHVVE